MDTSLPGQRLQGLRVLDFRQGVVTVPLPTNNLNVAHTFPLGLDFQSGV